MLVDVSEWKLLMDGPSPHYYSVLGISSIFFIDCTGNIAINDPMSTDHLRETTVLGTKIIVLLAANSDWGGRG